MPTPPARTEPSSLKITDFTPGIRQIKSLNHPPGTGAEGTYACYATPDGVLRALPGRATAIRHTGTSTMLPNLADLASEQYRIDGIFATDPIFSTGASPTISGPDQNNTDLWVAVEYYETFGTAQWQRKIFRYSRHKTTPQWTNIATATAVSATFDSDVRPSQCYFATSRSNNAAPADPGVPIMGWAWNGFAQFFPDDSASAADSVRAIPQDGSGLLPPDQLVGHQNRFVVFPTFLWGGGFQVSHPDNELIYWTEPNDARTLDSLLAGYAKVVAYPERNTGFQVQTVISNDALLLIKRAGGGLILSGDLNDYTAIPKPMIQSPGFSLNRGTTSAIGYMYPENVGGVWLLEGSGNRSVPIAPYMNPDFWRPAMQGPTNSTALPDGLQAENGWGVDHTSCCQWQRWAMFPANWLYDTETQAWWNLTKSYYNVPVETIDGTYNVKTYDERHAHWWTSDWTGRWAWSAPQGYLELAVDGGIGIVFYEYDRTLPADEFTWQSHPLPASMGKTIRVEDVIVTFEAFGDTPAESTVAIEFTADDSTDGVYDAETSSTATYTAKYVAGDGAMQTMRSPSNFSITGTNLSFTLTSTHADTAGTTEPPRIHSIEIIYHETNPVARSV